MIQHVVRHFNLHGMHLFNGSALNADGERAWTHYLGHHHVSHVTLDVQLGAFQLEVVSQLSPLPLDVANKRGEKPKDKCKACS